MARSRARQVAAVDQDENLCTAVQGFSCVSANCRQPTHAKLFCSVRTGTYAEMKPTHFPNHREIPD
jgi:hypothetical protein